VARTIVSLAIRPRREALVGTSAYLMSALWTLAPALAEAVIARMVRRSHLDHRHATADSVGNAFAPRGPEARTGGWRAAGRWRKRVALAAIPGAILAGAAWARKA
jgi:hypothetical protein